MSGKKSRDKGARSERAIVNLFRDHGVASERVPLSGAAGGSFAGDIIVDLAGKQITLEAKVRAGGFKQIYEWLGNNFGLVIKSDRNPPLIVIRLEDAAIIAAKLNGVKDE